MNRLDNITNGWLIQVMPWLFLFTDSNSCLGYDLKINIVLLFIEPVVMTSNNQVTNIAIIIDLAK